jgi:hypothetical protein
VVAKLIALDFQLGTLLFVLFITIQVGAAASLARAHKAASGLEEGPRLQMPETADVVVHTEP